MPPVLRSAILVLLLGVAVAAHTPASAADTPRASGLPVPRFVTLRSDEVNVRTGPGVRYPVEWVFVRRGMPVEITAEFDTWRRIRDWEGSEGWVHQSLLSGRRGIVILGGSRPLRAEPSAAAAAVATAEPGVMGTLERCKGPWCEVDLKGYKGWLLRDEMWGVYADEQIDD